MGTEREMSQWGVGFLAQVSVLVRTLLTNTVVTEDEQCVSLFQMGLWIEWVEEDQGEVFGV